MSSKLEHFFQHGLHAGNMRTESSLIGCPWQSGEPISVQNIWLLVIWQVILPRGLFGGQVLSRDGLRLDDCFCNECSPLGEPRNNVAREIATTGTNSDVATALLSASRNCCRSPTSIVFMLSIILSRPLRANEAACSGDTMSRRP